MEQKAKFIIIGLAGLLLISVIFAGQLFGVKSKLEAEVRGLNEANATLKQNLDTLQNEKNRIEQKARGMEQDLGKLQREREDLQKRLEVLNKEREELIAKVKSTKETVQPQAAQAASAMANDAYWASILKSNTDLELKLGNLRNELKGLQIKNEELLRNKASLDLEITNLNRDKKDLQRQIEYNQKILDNLTTELVNERNNKFKLQDDLKVIKNENATLRRQLNALNSRKVDLEKALQDLKEGKASLEQDFRNMEAVLKGKAEEMCRLQEQVEHMGLQAAPAQAPAADKGSINLPPIVVHPQAGEIKMGASAPTLIGKVLAVKRDNNFVIVDLGEASGAKPGDVLQVYRDDKVIGSITVVQVRKDISACDITKETTPIKLGDTVK